MDRSNNKPQVSRLAAFADNYIWLIHGQTQSTAKDVIIVDPGEEEPVYESIRANGYRPRAIFITHHHADHTGGVRAICSHYDIPVYGPVNEKIASVTHPCSENDIIQFDDMQLEFTIIDVPGHTRGHIAYFGHQTLFIGDTLFAGGCGRLFEGTHIQMHDSLSKILSLDDDTLIYCAHEYTEDNLQFAINVEPDSELLLDRIDEVIKLRAMDKATVPSSLKVEKQTNPFLRFNEKSVVIAAEQYSKQILVNSAEVFRVVREWKDYLD